MNKQNPIRAHKATKIRYFSDRLLGGPSANLVAWRNFYDTHASFRQAAKSRAK